MRLIDSRDLSSFPFLNARVNLPPRSEKARESRLLLREFV
jgi:hypothetical protein